MLKAKTPPVRSVEDANPASAQYDFARLLTLAIIVGLACVVIGLPYLPRVRVIDGLTLHLARVQSAVTRNPEAGIELASLVSDELLAHAAHEGEIVTIDGPSVSLRPKAAESTSLALHELATNAVKHGVLGSNNGGHILIRWRLNGSGEDKRELAFEWVEKSGNGQLSKPSRQGFGMELLTRILPYDLGAKTSVEFLKNGLRFTMDLPGEHLAGVDDARA